MMFIPLSCYLDPLETNITFHKINLPQIYMFYRDLYHHLLGYHNIHIAADRTYLRPPSAVPAPGSNQPTVRWVPGLSPGGWIGRGVKLNTQPLTAHLACNRTDFAYYSIKLQHRKHPQIYLQFIIATHNVNTRRNEVTSLSIYSYQYGWRAVSWRWHWFHKTWFYITRDLYTFSDSIQHFALQNFPVISIPLFT